MRNHRMMPVGHVARSLATYVSRRLRTRRRGWNRDWSRSDYDPYWKVKSIPTDVGYAVETGWFEPGATTLDIGCGSGEIAVWLAEQGLNVVGVDFADAAIDRARSYESSVPERLQFEVVDICEELPSRTSFKALLDRGCFHHIPKRLLSSYARNVAACSAPGARFLLLARTERAPYVRRYLAPMFDISRAEETWLVEETEGVEPRRGMAFWMVRR